MIWIHPKRRRTPEALRIMNHGWARHARLLRRDDIIGIAADVHPAAPLSRPGCLVSLIVLFGLFLYAATPG